MVLHGPKLHWYCNYDLEWLMWHWCCAEGKSEKVTCLACLIYTGKLWRKELLSEQTEPRLGMWYHISILNIVMIMLLFVCCVSLMLCVSCPEFAAAGAFLIELIMKCSRFITFIIQWRSWMSQYREIKIAVIATFCCWGWYISPSQKFHLSTFWMIGQKKWKLLLLGYSFE